MRLKMSALPGKTIGPVDQLRLAIDTAWEAIRLSGTWRWYPLP